MDKTELNRMRWAARRGMLELDLVLAPFVEHCYEALDSQGKSRFQALMICEDQDLFAWFLHRQQPQDPELVAIVEQILQFSRSDAAR